MKYYKLIILLTFFYLFNCSDNDTPDSPEVIDVYWNLVNVNGGISGTNEDFNEGIIKWTFNEFAGTLKIENNNTDDTKPDGIESGNYTYNIITSGTSSKTYLVIDDSEIGSIVVTANELVIDENERSEGTFSDGYIYTFSKTVITE